MVRPYQWTHQHLSSKFLSGSAFLEPFTQNSTVLISRHTKNTTQQVSNGYWALRRLPISSHLEYVVQTTAQQTLLAIKLCASQNLLHELNICMVLFMRFSLLLVVNIISLFQSALQDGSPVPRPWSQTLLEPWLTFQILLSVVLLIAANEKLKCISKFTVLVLLFCIICLFLNFIKFI